MVTTVRMLRQLSGTRDGAHWPGPGEVVDVSAVEAAALVRHGNATYLNQPDEDEAPEAQPEPPGRSDLKAAWVNHAVTRGMPRSEAEAMTKDDLIARFATDEG